MRAARKHHGTGADEIGVEERRARGGRGDDDVGVAQGLVRFLRPCREYPSTISHLVADPVGGADDEDRLGDVELRPDRVGMTDPLGPGAEDDDLHRVREARERGQDCGDGHGGSAQGRQCRAVDDRAQAQRGGLVHEVLAEDAGQPAFGIACRDSDEFDPDPLSELRGHEDHVPRADVGDGPGNVVTGIESPGQRLAESGDRLGGGEGREHGFGVEIAHVVHGFSSLVRVPRLSCHTM
ncbi:Uncharacterised protein [Mycobacteroides abscessus subsp. abscessus]|nr:Uncharacterised protein [Mycobacteroides abscessus subsp. abscessus]